MPERSTRAPHWSLPLGLLALASFYVTSGKFLTDGTLFWDNEGLYSYFWDHLNSLNRFGEPAWWLPHIQSGHPGYVYSMLGDVPVTAPLMAAISSVVWLLGRLGVEITHFHPLYVVYYGGLVPALFLVGLRAVLVQILRTAAATWYVLAAAAFSPGVIFNVANIGFLEHTAYGLLAVAAWMRFLAAPSRITFLRLTLAACVLAVSLGYPTFLWNVLFLPAVVLCCLFPAPLRRRTQRAFAAVPRAWLGLAAAAVIVCVLPPLLAAAQSGLLVRSKTGGLDYSPGVHHPADAIVPLLSSTALGSWYLGALALPLLVLGLVYGRPLVRNRLLALLVFVFCVRLAGGLSPLYHLLLSVFSPLRVMNHSEAVFPFGGSVLFLVGAGLGLDAMLRGRLRPAWLLPAAIGASLASALVIGQLRAPGSLHLLDALTATAWQVNLLAAGFALLLTLRIPEIPLWRRRVAWCLVALTMIETSTHLFPHRLNPMIADRSPYDVPNPDGIGLDHEHANTYALELLRLRTMEPFAGADLGSLPPAAIFSHGRIGPDVMTPGDVIAAMNQPERPLPLQDGADRLDPARLRPAPPAKGGVRVVDRTYNTIRLETTSDRPGLVAVLDAYHPAWSAEVNGRPAPVVRALGGFKAVPVGEGPSSVVLRFRPPGLAPALGAAYLLLAALAAACLGLLPRRLRAPAATSRP